MRRRGLDAPIAPIAPVAPIALAALAALASLLGAGCEGVAPEPDFERMIHQSKFLPYQQNPFFDDLRAMREPPLGTVARGAVTDDPAFADGLVANRDVPAIPVSLSRALLDRGRSRFEIICAACHGLRGDGESEVARNMELRKPPSLLDPAVRAFPPGRSFRVITNGYGLMRSYANDLEPRDRWAVIAYVRALQLSQGVPLDALPPAERAAALKELP